MRTIPQQPSNRLAGFMFAILIATVINGSMLWQFDSLAHVTQLANSAQTPTAITLQTVTIVGHQS